MCHNSHSHKKSLLGVMSIVYASRCNMLVILCDFCNIDVKSNEKIKTNNSTVHLSLAPDFPVMWRMNQLSYIRL